MPHFSVLRFSQSKTRKKRNLFYDKNKNFWQSHWQNSLFAKGVNPCFWSRNANFFIYLFSLKIRLETRFNNVLDRKTNFSLTIKTKFYKVPKNRINFIFSKKVNPCFQSLKNCIFPKG